MKLRHVALVYSSEENADRFLCGVLGLQKSEPKLLPGELNRAIFGRDGELRIIYYSNTALCFEVFIAVRQPGEMCPFAHVLLEVENLADFLERRRRTRASIRTIPRGASVLIFVNDEDSNLFEIKEAKPVA